MVHQSWWNTGDIRSDQMRLKDLPLNGSMYIQCLIQSSDLLVMSTLNRISSVWNHLNPCGRSVHDFHIGPQHVSPVPICLCQLLLRTASFGRTGCRLITQHRWGGETVRPGDTRRSWHGQSWPKNLRCFYWLLKNPTDPWNIPSGHHLWGHHWPRISQRCCVFFCSQCLKTIWVHGNSMCLTLQTHITKPG